MYFLFTCLCYLDQFKLDIYFIIPFLICSGGLRLKRDITEYGEFVRSFNAPSIDEKFELLGMYVYYFYQFRIRYLHYLDGKLCFTIYMLRQTLNLRIFPITNLKIFLLYTLALSKLPVVENLF